jgi:hypothetical protein
MVNTINIKNAENKGYIIQKSVELIKSFNPTLHSIDTHCLEHLGDTNKPVRYFFSQFNFYKTILVLEGLKTGKCLHPTNTVWMV